MMPDLKGRLERALTRETRPSSDFDLLPGAPFPPGSRLRAASVLVPIIATPIPKLILTKRSSALKHHPGQIAFPGGKVDPDDDGVVGAALREAEEEIGLTSDKVEVLGTLSSHETVTGFQVTPVLSLVDPVFQPVPELGEVAEVFEVPLTHVLDPARYVVEGRMWRGQMRRYFAVPFGPYYIWGATARMLRSLADRMGHEDHAGLADR